MLPGALQGGWEQPAAEASAPFAEGDGWDTGSQLPGGSVHLGLSHDGEGLAALAPEVPCAPLDHLWPLITECWPPLHTPHSWVRLHLYSAPVAS
jgi:hypothetical protein